MIERRQQVNCPLMRLECAASCLAVNGDRTQRIFVDLQAFQLAGPLADGLLEVLRIDQFQQVGEAIRTRRLAFEAKPMPSGGGLRSEPLFYLKLSHCFI